MQSYEKRLIYESGVRFFYINFIFNLRFQRVI